MFTVSTALASVVWVTGVPQIGTGFAVPGILDRHGRLVVFEHRAAQSFYAMVQAANGYIQGKDITSTTRTIKHNRHVGGVWNSRHLDGTAVDVHGISRDWIRANGNRYGWCMRSYAGSHGGHFIFNPVICKRPGP